MSDLYNEGYRSGFPEQWEGVEICPVCGEQLDAVVRAGIIGRLSGVEVCSLDGDLILHDLPSKIVEDNGVGYEAPIISRSQCTMREGSEPLFKAEIERVPADSEDEP